MLQKLFIILCFTSVWHTAFADAMPKGYQKYRFDMEQKIDSVMIQESERTSFLTYDTLMSHWQFAYIPCQDNKCHFWGHSYMKYQRLILFSGGRQIHLPVYEPIGSNPSFVVTHENGTYTVTETTSFLFRGKTGEVLRALLITLVLELLVALTMLGEYITKRNVGYILLANCISLPLAWLSFDAIIPYTHSSIILILIIEVVIVLFEYAFLRYLIKGIPKSRIFWYSLNANLLSFFLGGILYLITTFL